MQIGKKNKGKKGAIRVKKDILQERENIVSGPKYRPVCIFLLPFLQFSIFFPLMSSADIPPSAQRRNISKLTPQICLE
jgi:hypothetical protein